MKSKGVRIVLLIAAAFLLFGFLSGLRASSSLLISSISECTGLSYGTVSIAFTVMNLVLAFSGPLFGLLTLKFTTAKIMIAGAIMGGIGLLGTAFSSNLPALIVFMGVFFGLGAAALCYSMVYAAAVPVIGQKYSIVLGGILGASQGAVSMIFAPLFTLGSQSVGIQTCLIITGIVSLCLVPLCFLFLPKKAAETTAVEKPVHAPLRKTLKEAVPLSFLLLMMFGMFAYGMCDGEMINHLHAYAETFGVSETVSAAVVSVYSCACMAGALAGGIICSRVRNRRLVFAAIYLVWFILFIIGYFAPTTYVSGFTITALCGIGMGMCMPTLSAIALEVVPIDKFAAVYSLLYFFIILAYAVMSLLGGMIFDMYGNFVPVDIITAVFAAGVVLLFTVSGLKRRKVLK